MTKTKKSIAAKLPRMTADDERALAKSRRETLMAVRSVLVELRASAGASYEFAGALSVTIASLDVAFGLGPRNYHCGTCLRLIKAGAWPAPLTPVTIPPPKEIQPKRKSHRKKVGA